MTNKKVMYMGPTLRGVARNGSVSKRTSGEPVQTGREKAYY